VAKILFYLIEKPNLSNAQTVPAISRNSGANKNL
jgi:hypothetical protein